MLYGLPNTPNAAGHVQDVDVNGPILLPVTTRLDGLASIPNAVHHNPSPVQAPSAPIGTISGGNAVMLKEESRGGEKHGHSLNYMAPQVLGSGSFLAKPRRYDFSANQKGTAEPTSISTLDGLAATSKTTKAKAAPRAAARPIIAAPSSASGMQKRKGPHGQNYMGPVSAQAPGQPRRVRRYKYSANKRPTPGAGEGLSGLEGGFFGQVGNFFNRVITPPRFIRNFEMKTLGGVVTHSWRVAEVSFAGTMAGAASGFLLGGPVGAVVGAVGGGVYGVSKGIYGEVNNAPVGRSMYQTLIPSFGIGAVAGAGVAIYAGSHAAAAGAASAGGGATTASAATPAIVPATGAGIYTTVPAALPAGAGVLAPTAAETAAASAPLVTVPAAGFGVLAVAPAAVAPGSAAAALPIAAAAAAPPGTSLWAVLAGSTVAGLASKLLGGGGAIPVGSGGGGVSISIPPQSGSGSFMPVPVGGGGGTSSGDASAQPIQASSANLPMIFAVVGLGVTIFFQSRKRK